MPSQTASRRGSRASRNTGTTSRNAGTKAGKARRTPSSRRTASRPAPSVAKDHWGTSRPEAVRLLKKDHKVVKKLLQDLDAASAPSDRRTLFEQVEVEILVHAKLEEEVFYPAYLAACDSKEERKLYFEAEEEHDGVHRLLEQMRDEDVASETFGAKAKVLMDHVLHHAKEEEAEMFSEAKRLMDRAQLEELGRQMQDKRLRIMGQKAEPSKFRQLLARNRDMGAFGGTAVAMAGENP